MLRYVCSELLKGERKELELRVLAEGYMYYMVFYFDNFPQSFSNPDMVPPDTEITRADGRDYFLEYLAVAQELADVHGMEWMQENEPYKWKILVMVQEIKQELEREAEQGAKQEKECSMIRADHWALFSLTGDIVNDITNFCFRSCQSHIRKLLQDRKRNF